MTSGRALALLPLMLLFAACSADPSADDATLKANIATPTTAGLTETDQPPVEAPSAETPPAETLPNETLNAETPPGTAPAGQPAAPPEPATSHVPVKYLIGDVDPSKDPKFARIPDKYIGGSRVWGHKDAVEAFVRMAEDAAANGYHLKIVSAFRSFSDQKQIWEDKWTGKTLVGGKKLNVSLPDANARALKILTYSSMPATSRHHWGTDFDINSIDPKYFNTRDGKRLYDWLVAHAPQYGFCQVYSHKGDPGERTTGYEEEKWHWSYLPVAGWYLKQYPVDVGYDHIKGFLGADAAPGIDVIKTYVQGINPECLQ